MEWSQRALCAPYINRLHANEPLLSFAFVVYQRKSGCKYRDYKFEFVVRFWNGKGNLIRSKGEAHEKWVSMCVLRTIFLSCIFLITNYVFVEITNHVSCSKNLTREFNYLTLKSISKET